MNQVMKEWAYAREVLRCLGFLPDELFFSVTNSSVVSVVLKSQEKNFTWVIGISHLSSEELVTEYKKLCDVWNSGGAWNVTEFLDSKPFKQKEAVIIALQNKGFVLPATN